MATCHLLLTVVHYINKRSVPDTGSRFLLFVRPAGVWLNHPDESVVNDGFNH